MSGGRRIVDRVPPRRQTSWDARAATNFVCGGAGGGLTAAVALASLPGDDLRPLVVLALALVATGLTAVWFEIGRPLRALNVFRNAATSWMTREAMIAPLLFVTGAAAVLGEWPAAGWVAGLLGLAYLYAQARMLHANKGIPAWRARGCVAMMVATGLTEGVGLLCVASLYWPGLRPAAVVLAALVAARLLAWRRYLATLRGGGAPAGTLKVFDEIDRRFVWLGHVVPFALCAAVALGAPAPLAALAGALAAAAGGGFKYVLVRRAAFTQGFALPRSPARGGGRPGDGAKPGWDGAGIVARPEEP